MRLRIRARAPTGSTLILPRTSHCVASPSLPPRSDRPRRSSGGDRGCSPNPRSSGLLRTTASHPVIHGRFPLPSQTRRGGAASVAGERALQSSGAQCAHAQEHHALSAQNTSSPKTFARSERRACALPTNSELPCACSSSRGSDTRPPNPFRPHPSNSANGNDDSAEDLGGGLYFGAFLSLEEAIGCRGAREAGQIVAGSVPPVEPGDAVQELSLCLPSPESRLLFWLLLRLGSCCYPRT